MSKRIKTECKSLLKGSTLKLFFISFFSFLFRYGGSLGLIYLFYTFINSSFTALLKNYYGNTSAYLFICFLFSLILFLFLLICSDIKQKENYCYYLKSKNLNFEFRCILKAAKVNFVFKVFIFYAKNLFIKVCWLIYFCVPCLLYFLCILPFIKSNELPDFIYTVIFICGVFIILFSFTMWRFSALRYCHNTHIYFSDSKKVKSILINKQDLKDAFLLKSSFTGWILSCLFIFPVFFVVPYKKLCFTLACKAEP